MNLCTRWLRLWGLVVLVFIGSYAFADARAFEIICLPTISKMPTEHRCPVLCNQIGVLIETELSRQKNVNLVSRKFMAAILNEKTMELKGLSSQQQKEWNKFKASGTILCSSLFLDEKTDETLLTIELISAQNGQCVIESKIELQKKNPSAWPEQIENAVTQLCKSLPAASKRLCSSMLVEATVTADVRMKHAYWRSKPLAENMDAALAKLKYVTLLKPRQPQATLEERILRVMGLTDADQPGHDKLVYLKPTPTGRLDVKFTEYPKEGQAIDDFKFSADVVMKNNSHIVFSQKIEGTIGEFGDFQDDVCHASIKACEALAKKQGITIKTATSLPAVDSGAKKQAKAEMEAINKWTRLVESYGDSPRLSRNQKMQIAKRALRAWNLDPTYEYAAYMACVMNKFTYPFDTNYYEGSGKDARRKILQLLKKYVDYFGDSEPRHYQLIEFMRKDYGINYSISVTDYITASANLGISEMTHGDFYFPETYRNFLYSLANYFECEYVEGIEERYQKWKSFFFDQYKPLWEKAYKSGKVKGKLYYSWELVEAFYYAKLEKPEKVKEAFQRAASKYAIEQKEIWGERGAISDYMVLVKRALGNAGVKNPAKWKPVFHHLQSPEEQRQIEFVKKMREFSARMNQFCAPDITKYQPVPLNLPCAVEYLPSIKYCSAPDGQKYSTSNYSVQPIGVINKKWWLYVSPVLHYTSDRDVSHYLAVGRNLDKPQSKNAEVLFELPWPKYPAPENRVAEDSCDRSPYFHIRSYYIELGKSSDEFTIWVGTAKHGLAKIVYNNCKITGRWFTTHDGLPAKAKISDIFPVQYKSEKGLLLSVGYDYHQVGGRKSAIIFLDSKRNSLRLIKDDLKPFALLKFPNNSIVVLPNTPGYDTGVFSSNRSMCSWADAIKPQLNYLAENDLDNIKVSCYGSYPPVYAFAMNYNNKGYIYMSGNDMGWLDKHYKTLRSINLVQMGRNINHEHLGVYMSAIPCAFVGSAMYFANYGDMVAMVTRYKPNGDESREYKYLFYLWRPGKTEPFIDDKWYGPFAIDDDVKVANIFPGDSGYVWLIDQKAGDRHIRVNIKSVVDAASSKGYVFTTAQEMDKFFSTLGENDWRMFAKGLASNRQINNAHELLDRIIEENSQTRNVDYFDAHILKAAIYALTSKSYDKALAIHKKILSETQSPEYEFLSQKSTGFIYFGLKDYERAAEFLSKARKFPEALDMWKRLNKNDDLMFHLYCNAESDKWLSLCRKKIRNQQAKAKFAEQPKTQAGVSK